VTSRVHLKFLPLDLVASWVLEHSSIVEGLFEPLDTLSDRCDLARGDLCVDAVCETLFEVTLHLFFILHHADIVVHLLGWGQNNRLALVVELGTTGTTKDLLHVEDADILVSTH
jgi:hypothetical protein